jgi:Uma2 family endonuclease
MVSQLETAATPSATPIDAIVYPDSDGQPMADNTKQFEWIVLLKKNLDVLFADNPNVFVAGDLLWYPVQGCNQRCTAPDVMVVTQTSQQLEQAQERSRQLAEKLRALGIDPEAI